MVYVLIAPGIALYGALKILKLELDLLADIDMLSMEVKGIRGGICQAIYQYEKVNNKYMKDYDKNKESYINYWDVNNLYGWEMSHKLPLGGFKWIEEILQFNKDIPES